MTAGKFKVNTVATDSTDEHRFFETNLYESVKSVARDVFGKA
jgi:hypothetical protein